MTIYLIGLPGSGKSTLGRLLAKQLNYDFKDTDQEIVMAEGKSVEDIFEQSGEAYFRLAEQNILKLLAKGDDQVISTGGGLPCFFDNMTFMNSTGITIFIDVPLENLVQRIWGAQLQARPMFKNKNQVEVFTFLKEKANERVPIYSNAILRISGSNIKIETILESINDYNRANL